MSEPKYRYRTNWRGKIILQIYVDYCYGFNGFFHRYRDATVEDITLGKIV